MDTTSVTIREVLRSKLSLYCWSYKRWLSVHKFEGTVLGLSELTKELVDLAILDQLQAVTPSSLSSKWKDPHSLYMYGGLCVYRELCFIHSSSEKILTALKINLKTCHIIKILKLLNWLPSKLHQFSELQPIVAWCRSWK